MEAEVSRIAVSAISVPLSREEPRSVPIAHASHGFVTDHLWVVIATLSVSLLFSIVICACFGAVHIPVSSAVQALLLRHPLTETQRIILYTVRLPRVLASAVVGAALAVSGLMFQGLFRNPMADPYIIGSSGGAIVGGCIGMIFLSHVSIFGFSAMATLAFVGSVLTMGLVYSLARTRGHTNIVTLLLAGFAISTMLSNCTYIFEIIDPNSSTGTRVLAAWLHGVIGVPHWSQLAVTAVLLVTAMLAAFPLMRRLNTLALGDEYAQHLGIRVERTRVAIIVVASLLTAAAVSLGGLISFAGLIVPHVARLLLGPDHVRLLPVTALGGAIFVVVADTLARTVFAPAELPVGVLMVFMGGPFFLYLLRKSKREYAV